MSPSTNAPPPLPQAYHPLIAGYDNCNIRQITEETGVRIHLPPTATEKDEIVVSGEKASVALAVLRLTAMYV